MVLVAVPEGDGFAHTADGHDPFKIFYILQPFPGVICVRFSPYRALPPSPAKGDYNMIKPIWGLGGSVLIAKRFG